MASSGRVPKPALRLMKQTIEVGESASTGYGKAVADGGTREVACLLQPGVSVYRTMTNRDDVPTWVAYCDDIDITADSIVKVDGVVVDIGHIDTWTDEKGPMYQVVDLS